MARNGDNMERTRCRACPLRKFSLFIKSNDEEVDFIQEFKRGELHVEPGSTILHEGANAPHLFTVLSGWAYRSKTTLDGKVQILNFALPGDLVGLQTAIMGEMDHSVTALSQLKLCVFERTDVWKVFQNHPTLAFSMTWLASREERILDQNLLSVGQHSGLQKVAYLLLHLFDRAESVGMTQGKSCKMPLTQQHIAQALGLTNVHVSRMATLLAQRGLLQLKNGVLTILDREKAERLASYNREMEEGRRPIV
jgi:CRP/FNR family transcriptional regulator